MKSYQLVNWQKSQAHRKREKETESQTHRETSAVQDLLSQYELPTFEGYISIFYFLLEATAELLNFV